MWWSKQVGERGVFRHIIILLDENVLIRVLNY